MSLTSLNKNIIKMLSCVFTKHKGITSVVLFGSRAKGTEEYNSDIDLAINGVDDDLIIEAIKIELEELPLPYRFDVKSFDSIRNSALREHIKRVGVTIYDNNEL